MDLSWEQCSQILRHTVIPGNPDKLNPNSMKYQATATKRSSITFAQQFFWHTTFEAVLNKLRELNTGEYNLTGKTFRELIWNFIVDGDKTFMHVSLIHLNVNGLIDRKNHEKILYDSRCSITMYCTGPFSGNTGPTVFVMEGEIIRPSVNEKLLKKNGAKEGSTIIMNPTAFIIEEAWKKMMPSIVKVLCTMPNVKENPQWWMLEIFDGFGPHLSSLAAMEIRHNNNTISMKEEGKSSYDN